MKRCAHGLMGIEVEKIAVIFFFPELIRRGVYSRIQYSLSEMIDLHGSTDKKAISFR